MSSFPANSGQYFIESNYNFAFKLGLPFEKSDNAGILRVHVHYLALENTQRDAHWVIVTPKPWGSLPPFQIYNKVNEKSLEEAFVSVEKGDEWITHGEMEEFYSFYIFILKDLYDKKESQTISQLHWESSFTLSSCETTRTKNYLVLPGCRDGSVDKKLIKDFLEFKRNPMISKKINWKREFEHQKQRETQSRLQKKGREGPGSQEAQENLEDESFWSKIKLWLFESSHTKIRYFAYDIVMSPQTTTMLDFIKKVLVYCMMYIEEVDYEKKLESLIKLFDLTQEESKRVSLWEYFTQSSKATGHSREYPDMIKSLKNIQSANGISFEEGPVPFVFVHRILSVRSFEFNSKERVSSSIYSSCHKDNVSCKISNINLLTLANLRRYPMSIKMFDDWIRIPSAMVQAERLLLILEFQSRLNLSFIPVSLLTVAMTPSALANTNASESNYEDLELLGDSLLKSLVAFDIFQRNPYWNESIMTNLKGQIVKNDYMMRRGFMKELHLYIKSNAMRSAHWVPPFVSWPANPNVENVSFKQVADVIEAILAVSSISNDYKLFPVTRTLLNLDFFSETTLREEDPYMQETLLIDQQEVDLIWEEVTPELTYNQLANIRWKINQKNQREKPKTKIYSLEWAKSKMAQSGFTENQKQNPSPFKSQKEEGFKGNTRVNCQKNSKEAFESFSNEPKIRTKSNGQRAIDLVGSAYHSWKTIYKQSYLYRPTAVWYVLGKLKVLEEKFLGYRFKNKHILLTALTFDDKFYRRKPFWCLQSYQSLEFLGDAVIEGFVIANCYHIWAQQGKRLSPGEYQKVKNCLLSNQFMAILSVKHKFHKFLLVEFDEGSLSSLNLFVKRLKVGPYYKFWLWGIESPKVISDIFESLAGAVLLDGGWAAFKRTFGRIMIPFIVFCCKHLDVIQINRFEFLEIECITQGVFKQKGKEVWKREEWKAKDDEYVCQLTCKGRKFVGKGENAKAARDKAGNWLYNWMVEKEILKRTVDSPKKFKAILP